MANTEEQRRDLFNELEQTLGAPNANFIMERLPNQPAEQLVTRTDMHAFGTGLRGEMAELRAELRGEMAELRGEMNTKFATAKVETQRLIVAGMIANAIAVIAALLT